MALMAPTRQKISAFTLFLSLSLFLCVAFAASGGRMGGDCFSKRSSKSSSSYHSSHSPPSNHHYHHHHYHHGSRWHSSNKRAGSENDDVFSRWGAVIVTFGVVGAVSLVICFDYMQSKGSVVVVQVGLIGKARSLQKELNEIAESTDTSSPSGWQLILSETASALLRHPHYFISGYSSVKQHWSAESVEKSFRELSGEEREKIDMESLVNVNNVKRQRTVIPKASKLGKDYMVVTVLIAAKGSYRIPAIKSIDDMKDALRSLKIATSNLLAVEVLWTPQDENDILSEDELLENYPLLRPI